MDLLCDTIKLCSTVVRKNIDDEMLPDVVESFQKKGIHFSEI